MSKYTTELRYILESGFDIGLKDYPIYKEEYREPLNKKIKEHFKYREIGLETPALFRDFLNRKMNEIMPYYNQMYASVDIKFNPLWNVEMHETYTHTVEETGETTGKSKTNDSKSGTQEQNSTENRSELIGERTDNSIIEDTTSSKDTILSDTEHSASTGTSSDKTNSTENKSLTVNGTDDTTLSDTEGRTTTSTKSDTPQSNLTDADILANKYISEAGSQKDNITKNSTQNSTKENTETQDNTQEVTKTGSSTDDSTKTLSSTGKDTLESEIHTTQGTEHKADNKFSINAQTGLQTSESGLVETDNELNTLNKKTETFTRLEEGSSAGLPYSDAIRQWRKIMVNIDMLIMQELEPLFMQLW